MSQSKDKVDQQVRTLFQKYDPYVVSLSEPYQHNYSLSGVQVKEPAGGLTAALDPILRKYGGTWIATGSGDADWEFVDDRNSVGVPPEDPSYNLRRIKLPRYEIQNFYYGFNHETFWPLLHTVFHRPDFIQDYWKGYRQANSLYAQAVLDELGNEQSLLWFQDFQLSLAPREVRREIDNQEIKMVHFWHVPWPPPEVFSRCPWAEQLLDGLLANDLIGFHTESHARNFLYTVDQLDDAQVSVTQGNVNYKGRTTSVEYSPISVDFTEIDQTARSTQVKQRIQELQEYHYVQNKSIGLGIDRLDYAKGIPERLEAIDHFLSDFPEYKEDFLFVQAGAPLLSRVADYRNLTHKVERMVDDINQKHEQNSWRPIWFLKKKVDTVTIRALQRLADLYIVTSLHDGMNLVAKENLSADVDMDGHLVLSQFTGAAEELQEARLVNPYDTEGVSKAIHEGLELDDRQKKKNISRMRERVKEHDIYHWLGDFLEKTIESLDL